MPYDGARLTLADGVGKWWEGFDPRMLYLVNMREYAGIYNGYDRTGSSPAERNLSPTIKSLPIGMPPGGPCASWT